MEDDAFRPRSIDAARWERIQSLFHAAADLEPDARLPFLTAECGDDEALKADVEAMLAEDAAGGSLLDSDRATLANAVVGTSYPVPGGGFGPYRIVRPIGEGGAGIVYLARRDDLQNQVAIKFLRDAWLSSARRERFASEQRTLAQLNHPAIARLYDAGTLTDGTPWFVMEYVDGAPLDVFCARERCSIEQRLRLFRAVCEAVAYAHQNGVIHRDIKPSNILVKADYTVRLLDFGIAKQIEPTGQLADPTRTALRLMTPAYASPEQIRGGRLDAATDVYSLGVVLYQLVTGRLPFDLSTLTPGEALTRIVEEQPIRPSHAVPIGGVSDGTTALTRAHLARLDVMCLTAMHKDPARRYRSAEALVREVDRFLTGEALQARGDPVWYSVIGSARRRRHALAAAAAVALAAAVAWSIGHSGSPRAEAAGPLAAVVSRTVAVLPFQNPASDLSLDYLRLALPDEVATTLSNIRSVTVRPFSATSKYERSGIDLQAAGREMGATTVLTGHFLRAGNTIQITLEALDVDANRVVWRDTLDVPAGNLVATQSQLGLRVRGGLAVSLGWPSSTATTLVPKDEAAYELFLKSAALRLDPSGNAAGLAMLEQSVALDPHYPPAWVALARRYYVDQRYGTARIATIGKYEAALRRALALDPEYVAAASGLALGLTESGDLVQAYRQALDLVRRRPDSIDAHFVLSYVLRYAGVLDEAADECNTAFLLDPRTQTSGLRSCAYVFLLRSDYARAMTFLDLDHGSDFAKALSILIRMRQGRLQDAISLGNPNMPQWRSYDLLMACLVKRPPAEIETLAARIQPSDDHEADYVAATHFAFCGQPQRALAFLRSAARGHYCGYPAMDTDPSFAGMRDTPAFADVRSDAIACQQDFLRRRGSPAP